MKTDGLFVIMCIVFIFVAWVASGGPTRPISQAGPFITPVTRSGEESQGYRQLAPTNPINTSSYPKQIGGTTTRISSGKDLYARGAGSTGTVYLEHSTFGAAEQNPNQEYIRVVNVGSASISLANWRVASAATGASAFFPAAIVPAGGAVAVITGRQNEAYTQGLCSSSTTCLFLNRNLELYASAHETITLYDQSGKKVDSFSY